MSIIIYTFSVTCNWSLACIITRSTYAHHASRQILEKQHEQGVDVEVIKVIQLASEMYN